MKLAAGRNRPQRPERSPGAGGFGAVAIRLSQPAGCRDFVIHSTLECQLYVETGPASWLVDSSFHALISPAAKEFSPEESPPEIIARGLHALLIAFHTA